MPNGKGKYKPKNAYQYKNTYYDKKSSEHGHFEPEITGKRYGSDGSQASVTQMRWVEDNRNFSPETSAPTPEPKPEPVKERTPVEHSSEVKQAKERVVNFKTNMDGNAGSDFSTDNLPETEVKAQGLADKYKLNLIEQAVPGS